MSLEEQNKKDHDAFLDDLANSLEPTKAVHPLRLYLFWLLISLASTLAFSVFMGWNNALSEHFFNEASVLVTLGHVFVGLFAAWFAILLSLPGRQPGQNRRIALVAICALLIFAPFIFLQSPAGWSQWKLSLQGSFGCGGMTLLFALVPVFVLAGICLKLAPMQSFWVSVMIALAAMSFAGLGIHLHCRTTNACHMAIGHLLPVFLGTFLISWPLQQLMAKWKQL
ncbi:MAG: DUF1109 family protein [Deltaproteobacteria bacterium]|nr:DUF1109 family protein [Deltaproteobacteria bacterium]